MAFNFQTFKTRTLTAIIFAVVMLSGLLINQWTFFVLFSVIHFGCWIEYQKLIGLIDKDYQQINSYHKYGIMLLGWCFMLWMTDHTFKLGTKELQGIGWLLMMFFSVLLLGKEIVFKKQLNIKLIGYSVLGLIYISLCWGLMMGLRNESWKIKPDISDTNGSWLLPVIIIACIWINDTMQYLVGSFIGKTPFSKISPKKTWEGTIGGSLLAITIVAMVLYKIFSVQIFNAIAIPAIVAVMGTLGDLLESKLKRMADVKDSGNFMPGHGGFLDRFDSLLLATPFVWIFMKLFF